MYKAESVGVKMTSIVSPPTVFMEVCPFVNLVCKLCLLDETTFKYKAIQAISDNI